MSSNSGIPIYFSDFFGVDKKILESYDALNACLVTDLPLFIDPFLLFNSKKPKYRELHENIIQYIKFLSKMATVDSSKLIKDWFSFPEVKQTWLGFCDSGNRGSGLGYQIAYSLREYFPAVVGDTENSVARGKHLEKLALLKEGVGRDFISDLVTNLIQGYLCEFTQDFAAVHLQSHQTKLVTVRRAGFNYETRTWQHGRFRLPWVNNDYVILTPIDMLTKDDCWINKEDLMHQFYSILTSMPNDILRSQVNRYLGEQIGEEENSYRKDKSKVRKKRKNKTEAEVKSAIRKTLQRFPQLLDYFIKKKEDEGDSATAVSREECEKCQHLAIDAVGYFRSILDSHGFYSLPENTLEEAIRRANFLKQVIENNDGYRIFWKNGQPIGREADFQLLYRLTWLQSFSDVNREVDNGRGPVDFKISRGQADKTVVEMKLASNTHLRKNFNTQVEIYAKANRTNQKVQMILYFTEAEAEKLDKLLIETGAKGLANIITIDARADNKPSASVA